MLFGPAFDNVGVVQHLPPSLKFFFKHAMFLTKRLMVAAVILCHALTASAYSHLSFSDAVWQSEMIPGQAASFIFYLPTCLPVSLIACLRYGR